MKKYKVCGRLKNVEIHTEMIVFAKSMDEATEIAYEMLKDKRAYKTIVDNYEIEDGDYDVEEIEF